MFTFLQQLQACWPSQCSITRPRQRCRFQSAMWHRSHGLPGTLHTIWLLAGAAAPRLRTGQMKVIICEPWPPLLRSAPLCSALLPPIRCFNEEGFSGAASRAGGPLTGSRRWRPCKSAFNSTSLSPLPSELVYSTLARSGGNAELIKSWLDCKKERKKKEVEGLFCLVDSSPVPGTDCQDIMSSVASSPSSVLNSDPVKSFS